MVEYVMQFSGMQKPIRNIRKVLGCKQFVCTGKVSKITCEQFQNEKKSSKIDENFIKSKKL